MAARSACVSACELNGDQSPQVDPAQGMTNVGQSDGSAQRDYDFVEQPNEDFYCPVTLEILFEPHQTDCCGQHISQQAVDRLTREGKPCPMCKTDRLLTHEDKYFKRNVINKLQVCCLHKKSGCVWVGELGDLDSHSDSCLKRQWKCQYCNFETTYEEGTNDHTPNCPMYPEPCPNCCEIGTVPQCDVEKHLLVCPMELVECEFAHAGCDIQIPRRDLAKHLSENSQQHLMSATLLNLRLTRELHQKMEEKDQQIDTKLQQQTKDLDTKLQQQTKDLDTKLQQQTKDLDTKLQDLDTKLQDLDTKLQDLDTKLQDLDTKLQQHSTQLTRCTTEIKMLIGFTQHDFILHKFKEQQRRGGDGSWHSDPFYNYPGGYRFDLNIDTNGCSEAHGTHLSAYFYLLSGGNDRKLKWPIKCTVHLEMLNQQGDHGHHMVTGTMNYFKVDQGDKYKCIGTTNKYFHLSDLGHNVAKNIQYLKNDSLHFRLFLKVSSE